MNRIVIVVVALSAIGCAGARPQKEKEKIVACTNERQWTVDEKTGIHVCFGAEGGLHYTAKPLSPASEPAKPAARKPRRPKVEAER